MRYQSLILLTKACKNDSSINTMTYAKNEILNGTGSVILQKSTFFAQKLSCILMEQKRWDSRHFMIWFFVV